MFSYKAAGSEWWENKREGLAKELTRKGKALSTVQFVAEHLKKRETVQENRLLLNGCSHLLSGA